FLTLQRPPTPTLFPYTTLFRSEQGAVIVDRLQQVQEYLRRTAAEEDETGCSLLDALVLVCEQSETGTGTEDSTSRAETGRTRGRSEEHTSELQSRFDLVCRLLL